VDQCVDILENCPVHGPTEFEVTPLADRAFRAPTRQRDHLVATIREMIRQNRSEVTGRARDRYPV
jgi:hypothetical protein